jgi:hypothetical protein
MKVPPPPHVPAIPKTSGFAIASLIFGILGGFVLALVFGYLALSRIKRSGGALRGRGLAIGGVVLGWVWLSLLAVGAFVAVSSGPEDLPADAVCGALSGQQIREVPCTDPRADVYLESEHPPGSKPEDTCDPFRPAYTVDAKGKIECWAYI